MIAGCDPRCTLSSNGDLDPSTRLIPHSPSSTLRKTLRNHPPHERDPSFPLVFLAQRKLERAQLDLLNVHYETIFERDEETKFQFVELLETSSVGIGTPSRSDEFDCACRQTLLFDLVTSVCDGRIGSIVRPRERVEGDRERVVELP